MISVVIPLYNKESQIVKTLQSVLAQTYDDYEVIVVNDGSTDGSLEAVGTVRDPRIRIVSQNNAGVSAARNRGIEEARGEFVAFLDADDEWKPEYLAVQAQLTDKYSQCDVFAVNYEFHRADGKIEYTSINRLGFKGEDGVLDNYFEVAFCSHPPIWTSAVMIRKQPLLEIGGFPCGIRSGEDLLTWARLAAKFKIAYSKTTLAVFNIEGYGIKEKPKRVPQEPDYVGQELGKLKAPHIKKYRAHWHKMRANIYMRLRLRKECFKECCMSVGLNPFNYKVWAIVAANFLPSKLQPF